MIRKSLGVCILILGLFTYANPAFADDLVFTGSDSFIAVTDVAKAITDLQISGTTPSSTPVKLLVTNGTLSMSTTTGLTFTGPSSGSTLQFSGTLANLNAALATLTYTRSGIGSDTLEASLVNPGEVFFEGTNHLYEYISSTLDWNGAQTAAGNLTRYGATGYLATITSQEENDFVSARLGGAGWMGASDAALENDWKWVTGPEAGTSFWSGGIGGSTVPGQYSNWNTNEPNNSGSNEDCGQFLAGGSGKWNDLPCSGSTLAGYVVEFGAPGDEPSVVSKNITLTTVSGPLAPTDAVISNPTTSTLDIDWTSGLGSETNFIIEQSQGDCSGDFTQIASISSALTTYTATNLSPELPYCFRIKSTDTVTDSSYATTIFDFTLPNDPLTPTVQNATETTLEVRIPADGNLASGQYAALYSIQEVISGLFLVYPNGSFDDIEGFTSALAWNNSTLTGLSPNTPYSFRTRIGQRNSDGGYTSYSPVSDVIHTLASVPTSFVSTAKSQSTASLSWQGNGTSYLVSNDTLGLTTSASTNSVMVSGLACGRTYVFRVTALNGDGAASEYSSGLSVMTDNCSSGISGGTTYYSVPQTNIGTPVTPSSISVMCSSDKIITQNLKAPSRNSRYSPYTKGVVTEAAILQSHLNRLGFSSGLEDGIIGPISDGAIKRMQRFFNTTPDGLVGPVTRALLNNSCT